MRYIIVNTDGLITNAIEWDGEAEWSPPESQAAIKSDTGSSGDSYVNGEVVLATEPETVPEPETVALTFEELVAQASTFDELKALVLAQSN